MYIYFLNDLKIDNQLPDAYFPISFYKSTKGKTNKPMPFLTLNMFVEQQAVTQIFRFYIKIEIENINGDF